MTMNAYLDSLSKTTSSSTTTSPGAPKRNYGISSPTLLHQPTVDHHQILTDKKSEQEEQGDQLAEGRHRPAADWKKKFNYDDIDLTKSRTQRIMERTTSSGQ